MKGVFLYSACIPSIGPLKALYTSPPGSTVHSGTNSASLGSILAMQQLRAKTIHSHFQHHLYNQVVIYTAEWTGASRREWKFPSFETVAKGIRTRGPLIASPAFYRWATAIHNHHSLAKLQLYWLLSTCMGVWPLCIIGPAQPRNLQFTNGTCTCSVTELI